MEEGISFNLQNNQTRERLTQRIKERNIQRLS